MVLVSIVCIALPCVGAAQPEQAARPPETLEPPPFVTRMDRVAADVTIYRDVFGVPHIVGKNEAAIYFAFGYAQAEDNVAQILKNYLTANGNMAEIFGEQFLLSDSRARLFRFRDMAMSRYAELDPRVKLMAENFVAGINYYLATHRGEVPGWVTRISPHDAVALMKYFIHIYYQLDFQNVEQQIPPGSNACAIGTARSASGKAMLLADPHLPWSALTQLYEAHLQCSGLNVSGATLLGLPVILIGHNDRISWTFTGNRPEVADVYEERLNRDLPGQYLVGASWEPMERMEDEISVATSTGPRQEKRIFLYTRHGPIVKVIGDVAYAVSLSGWQDIQQLLEWYLINRATNLGEFKSALALQHIPVFNFLYADVGGNIYYVYNGGVPVKSDHFAPTAPMPGWALETQWTGIVPFDQLPQTENPVSGFLLNCNNPPWFSTRDSDLIPARFPKYLSNDLLTFRAQRMMELLADDTSITVDEMKKVPWDNRVLIAEQAKPFISSAVDRLKVATPSRATGIRRAAEIIANWDGMCDVENTAASLFHAWFSAYCRAFPGVPVRDLVSRMGVPSAHETDVAVRALEEAVGFMLREYGRLDVRWGNVHKMRRSQLEQEVGGAGLLDPLNQIVEGDFVRGVSYAGGGHAFVMVAHMTEPVESFTIVPFGSSENPQSPHYADQMALFAKCQLKKAWFTEDDIFTNLESAWGSDIVLKFPTETSSARVQTVRPVAVDIKVTTDILGSPAPEQQRPLSKYFNLNGPPTPKPRIELAIGVQKGKQPAAAPEGPTLYYIPAGQANWQQCESRFDPERSCVTGVGTGFGTYAVFGPGS